MIDPKFMDSASFGLLVMIGITLVCFVIFVLIPIIISLFKKETQ